MEREHFAELTFSPLTYQDGLGEINSFYRTSEPEMEREHTLAVQVHDHDIELPHRVADDEFSTFLQDLKAMEGVEATDGVEQVLEDSKSDKDEHHIDSSSSIINNTTATAAERAPMTPTGQTSKASSPSIPMNLFESVKNTPGSGHRPIPPWSSNRRGLQAEMRDEEMEQNSPVSTPEAVPFSFARDKAGANTKRDASASPLATLRPIKKAKNAEPEEIEQKSTAVLYGSPGVYSRSPPRLSNIDELATNATCSLAATHMAKDRPESSHASKEAAISTPKTTQHELATGGGRRKSLFVTMPLPQRNRRGKPLVTSDNAAHSQSGASSSHAILGQEATEAQLKGSAPRSRAEEMGAQDGKSIAGEVSKEPAKPSTRVRRTMGAQELKDIIDTNSRKGVADGMTPQRMTRGKKQERDAARPNAKEAVKRRRKSSGK